MCKLQGLPDAVYLAAHPVCTNNRRLPHCKHSIYNAYERRLLNQNEAHH